MRAAAIAAALLLSAACARAAQDGAADFDNAPTPAAGPEVGRGLASWYGPRFHGRPTASGERFDMHAYTAAHRSLPFGTVVRVHSQVNGRTVEVRINDRGPHLKHRIIDLSRAAALALGLVQAGTGTKPVTVTIVPPPSTRAAAAPLHADPP